MKYHKVKSISINQWLNEEIEICDECRRASCWHGFFMCEDAYGAGTVFVPREQLLLEKRENPNNWYNGTKEEIIIKI